MKMLGSKRNSSRTLTINCFITKLPLLINVVSNFLLAKYHLIYNVTDPLDINRKFKKVLKQRSIKETLSANLTQRKFHQICMYIYMKMFILIYLMIKTVSKISLVNSVHILSMKHKNSNISPLKKFLIL